MKLFLGVGILLSILCSFWNGGQEEAIEKSFEFLEGKKSSFWKNLKTESDLEIFSKYKILYEKNRCFLWSKSDCKIPLVVHFIWLGPNPFPPESVANVRSWVAKHPSWTFKFWTDRDRPPPCKNMEIRLVQHFQFHYLAALFDQAGNWGEKSDLLRYEILFQEGGVYVDHDARALKSFESLHRGYDFYCGLQVPREPIEATEFFGLTVANGLIGAKPRHPILKKCMELVIARWHQAFRFTSPFEKTLFRSYIPFSLAVKEKADLEGNVDIVFPAAFFYAQDTLPALYSKHFFAASWLERKEKTKLENKKKSLQNQIRILSWTQWGLLTTFLLILSSFFTAVRKIGIVQSLSFRKDPNRGEKK